MPHKRERKTDIGTVPAEAMERAVKLIVQDKHSFRQVSKETGISKTTLIRYVNKFKKASETGDEISFMPKYASRKVFTDVEEKMLENYIIDASRIHHGLTPKMIRRLAYEFGVANSRNMPDTWMKNQSAGEDWLWHFRVRHQNLSLRQPESTSLSRATSFNRHNISLFFKNLKSIYDRFQFGPEDIYNVDESGLTTCHKPEKIIAEKGVKQIGKVTSAERGQLVTICMGINALGNSIPPFFIFPRVHFKEHMLQGAPVGSAGSAHSSGWMTAENFLLFMQHFIKYTKCTKEKPVLLLLDNHESHISIPVLDLAKNNGIHLLTFHPHTSHKMQPLDRSVFGPLKTYYNKACDSMMIAKPGRPLTIYDISTLAGTAFTQAMTQNNIVKGFQVTGIWPYNEDIFEDHEFLSSFVTDQPTSEEINNDHLEQSCSDIQLEIPQMNEATAIKSPEEICPFPKAGVRKSTGGRRKGSSKILTDTPIKNVLEQEALQKAILKKTKQDNVIKRAKKKLKMQIESDEDCQVKSRESENFLDNDLTTDEDGSKSIKVGKYVLVKFSTKKDIVHYVGLVLQNTDNDYVHLRFMRRKLGSNHFIFPETVDESIVDMKDIVMVLPDPNVSEGNSRMILTNMSFEISFSNFNIH